MADDDDVMEATGDELEDGDEFEEELDEAEIDPDELDEDELEEADEFEDEDDEFTEDSDESESDEAEEEAETPSSRRTTATTTTTAEDEDEDDDLLTPDDVEADLDTILKDRLVSAEEAADEDDEEADLADDPRTDPGDRLQPKRADELLCNHCFLLVRTRAPGCPMGDDACPIFT
jgi:hypothetical protein